MKKKYLLDDFFLFTNNFSALLLCKIHLVNRRRADATGKELRGQDGKLIEKGEAKK